ncbi:MAG TPA: sugar ABC transporter permease [Kineosporiaceae bacterium]|nr:sugar ABC transporter permease [Kineosporiaceae bacterium]
MLPYTVLLTVFGLAPVVYAVWTAFQVTPVVGPTYFSWVDNFTAVVADYRLHQASRNVLLYLALWLPSLLVFVFTVALVMDARRTRFASLTRFVAYVPGAVVGSAAALLWLFMFTPAVSPFRLLVEPFADREGSVISDGSLPVILSVMGIAAGAGGWIVLLYGALTAVPQDVLEAARIDGARAWQLVRHVKLPMIRGYAAFILIVSLANGFQVFVEPQVLGVAVQGRVSQYWSVNQIVYSYATGESNYGRASALSLLLLLVVVTAAVLVVTRTRFYSTGDR